MSKSFADSFLKVKMIYDKERYFTIEPVWPKLYMGNPELVCDGGRNK